MGTSVSLQFRNEQFFARSRKTRGCAEAYRGTSHKQPRRLVSPRLDLSASGWLTPIQPLQPVLWLSRRLRKRAIYGWKPINSEKSIQVQTKYKKNFAWKNINLRSKGLRLASDQDSSYSICVSNDYYILCLSCSPTKTHKISSMLFNFNCR